LKLQQVLEERVHSKIKTKKFGKLSVGDLIHINRIAMKAIGVRKAGL
jgi:hypothetical protein